MTDRAPELASYLQHEARGVEAADLRRLLEVRWPGLTPRRAAAGAAPDIETLIAKAQAFDAAWRAASENVANYLKAAALSFGDHFQKGLDLVLRRIAGEDYESIKGDPNTKVGKLLFDRDLPGENGKKPKTEPGDGPLTLTVNPGKRTIIPAKGGGGGRGSSGPDPDRFFDAQLRRTKERAEDVELETRMLGANTAERIKAKAALDLQQAAKRGDVTLTGEQIASLERETAKLGEVTSAYELARQRQSQSLALQTYSGNELLSVLDRIGDKSATVGTVVEDLTRSLLRAVAQSALLGTGPFAGLFGTAAAPGSGNAGGLIGAAFAALKGIGGERRRDRQLARRPFCRRRARPGNPQHPARCPGHPERRASGGGRTGRPVHDLRAVLFDRRSRLSDVRRPVRGHAQCA